ncbi:MAG: DHA2 family efflux MFS transporter permease subunit, partial [Chromatiales bacterium]|nr:DHA2 family efflux MFS transporter permease subunit [Chromatiales bacterium]
MLTATSVTFLYAMTVSIANVSLPQMQGSLSATQDQIAWVVTFNIVATAVVTPMSGWLVGRFGQRNVVLWSVATFALASLMCGLAGSLEALVLYRILQGGCGAPLVPVSQAIVLGAYPKHQHGTVTAIYGMGVVIGPILGPVIGGYLSEMYNWRWVFFMILPCTVVAMIGAWLFIHDRTDRKSTRLDWTGLLALIVSIACLQLMLDRGERAGWFDSWEIVSYAVLSCTGLYIFVIHCLTTENPFIPLALLKNRNFVVGLGVVLGFGMLNFTPMTLLPPLMQNLGGHPDSVIGIMLGARGIGTLAGFFTLFFASRFDPRVWLFIGFCAQGVAGWWMAQMDLSLSMSSFYWAIMLQGYGVGVLWVPITMIAFSTLPPRLVPDGTAFFHLLRNLGASIHISLSIAIVIRSTQSSYAMLGQHVSPYNENWYLPWVAGG